jgi:hypothetical protein
MGLRNRLSRHQERSAPFRLVRIEIPETREGLADVALIRREELDGFVEGLFGQEQSFELPERAHRALDALSELRAIFDGLYELAGKSDKDRDGGWYRTDPPQHSQADEGRWTWDPRGGVVLHARPAPVIELHADYETQPATDRAIAGGGRSFARWFSDQLVDQVDVVDVFLINE